MKGIVKKVIDEWNPLYLLEHAPDDEFDAEIAEITECITENMSIEEIGNIINRVFTDYFEEDFTSMYSLNECIQVAESIKTEMERINDK